MQYDDIILFQLVTDIIILHNLIFIHFGISIDKYCEKNFEVISKIFRIFVFLKVAKCTFSKEIKENK